MPAGDVAVEKAVNDSRHAASVLGVARAEGDGHGSFLVFCLCSIRAEDAKATIATANIWA